ncbi:MAG: TonB family protein [Puniceicoccaceae bacterium 5H]|nr:MAG: TonB family protein [Puniceicoccaceae bacterium 5H]
MNKFPSPLTTFKRTALMALVPLLAAAAVQAEKTEPKAKEKITVQAPDSMQDANLQDAHVDMLLLIGKDGQVADFVTLSAPSAELLEPAEAAVQEASFTPGENDGTPMPALLEVKLPVQGGTQDGKAIEEPQYAISNPKNLDQPLKAVEQGQTYVPSNEEGERIFGSAVVEFFVDRDGTVRVPRAVKSDDPHITEAAVMTLRGVHFTEPRIDGKPTAVLVRMPFAYNKPKEEEQQAAQGKQS